MSYLKFRNLTRSPMEAGSAPKWQRDVMEIAERDFSDQALEVNAKFKRDVLEVLGCDGIKLAGQAIETVTRRTPRYAFIKNIHATDGSVYDAQIDLLLVTVDFIKI